MAAEAGLGESIGAIAMTEPSGGSDLQNVKTQARRDGNHYVIRGAKTFITNGATADLIVTVTKTDPTQGAKGISLFVIEPSEVEGFRRGRKLDKIGLKANDTSELFFDDVRVRADALLGPEEGQGFIQLMQQLPQERLLIAIYAMARIERALTVTLPYVKERKAFGQRIIDFQNSQFELAECKTEAVMARVFIDHCIERHLERQSRHRHRVDGEVPAHRSAMHDHRPLSAAVRRLWLYERVPDRPDVSRRQGGAHLWRHQRDHEARDCPQLVRAR